MAAALEQAAKAAELEEIAILSTCNRTEIYASTAAKLPVEPASLVDWLASFHHVSQDELQRCHYWHQGEMAIQHMMKVACGLDSLVLGEPQILGQMKSAYAVAQEAGMVKAGLHSVFQQVFAIAKRVRTETAIGANPVSVAYAAVGLARQIFSDLTQDTALLIGAGETIELVARHLSEQGVKKIIVANRSLGRATQLASQFDAEAILLSDIPHYLHRADILISSTASQLPLLGKGAVESALKQRKHKPIFMVDIAVPRDIEVEVGELDDVYLYTVDDLRAVIEENKKSREEAAEKADTIIAQGVASYANDQRALNSVATIKAFRRKAEMLRDEELAKAMRSLEAGADPSRVLSQLARSLTNKLIHSPTTKLREASAGGRVEVIGISRELFDLTQVDIEESELKS